MALTAMLLGLIGGLLGLVIGVGLDSINAGPHAVVMAFHDLTAVKIASVAVPIAAMVGGAIARAKPLIGAVFMVLGTAGMGMLFNNDYPTQLAVAACALGAMLAILAGSRQQEAAAAAARM
jgi:hypothetical protein